MLLFTSAEFRTYTTLLLANIKLQHGLPPLHCLARDGYTTMSYCKHECMWMGPGWWDMEPSGAFLRGRFDDLCRSSRIVVFCVLA